MLFFAAIEFLTAAATKRKAKLESIHFWRENFKSYQAQQKPPTINKDTIPKMMPIIWARLRLLSLLLPWQWGREAQTSLLLHLKMKEIILIKEVTADILVLNLLSRHVQTKVDHKVKS